MRHVLTWADFTVAELQRILEVAADLQQLDREGNRPAVLARKVIGLLFEKPSLRTRVSFECLAYQTGAAALFLGGDVGWRTREPIQDFIPVLTSYVDCLVMRVSSHQDLMEVSRQSRCPVINGLTNEAHPCQALADLLTMEQIFSGLDGLRVAYVGDANNVAFSLALLSCKMGIEFRIASPPGYQFSSDKVGLIAAQAARSDSFHQFADPRQAVRGAQIVYTDVWTSMGHESEAERRRIDLANYQVNRELLEQADSKARFMHCLPARRGEEVTADVIDGPQSATVIQAENRLHAQKGLVVWLLTEAERGA